MKAIAVLSGGMDSTTLAYKLVSEGHEVKALSFDYGQRHKKEIEFAKITANKLGIEHKIAYMSSINSLIGKSALTSDIAVPHGHYADESMKQTVVPNRNMIMLALATGYAVNEGFDTVAYGAHFGDHAIYPDCRQEFMDKMAAVMEIANYEPIKLFAPFAQIMKEDIVREGIKLKVPYEDTWSCYEGLEEHCGGCGTCVERIEAFENAGHPDPMKYKNG